jgi:multidrug efflux pump subunit AcrB
MNITRAAIEKNRITAAALGIILVAGIGAYFNLPRAEDPGFIIRTALVQTIFPGASPERVELLVTDKLEKAIEEMPEIDFLRSETKTGISVINVNIQARYKEMQPIWDKLRRKVDRVTPDLPEGIIGPTVNDEFGDVFGTILTVTGEGLTYAELNDVADEVRDELLLIDEVAKVDIYGTQQEQVFVEYRNARLAELGLSPVQLQAILEARNIITPGGSVTTGDERIVLEPSGNFESVEELRRSVINLPGRRDLVYLEDIATIRRGYIDPPKTMTRASGHPALALAVSLREGGNILDLGEQVMSLYQRLPARYPIGVDFDVITFQPDYVDRKVNDFVSSVLQAIGIVVLVMLAFLGLRTGLVVSSLIPMAMVMALLIMSLLGIGLDQMSLASLIIALGMLVDNAIVMSESIMVQMAEGKSRVEAAVGSANELRIPLLTSSLTTAAAFLPIFLAKSNAGEYTAPIFKVVTITLLSSWLLALTMIPLLCYRFLKVQERRESESYGSPFYTRYRATLVWMLQNRLRTVAGIAMLFVLSMAAMRWVPNIFFPPGDRAVITGEIRLPTGSPIERTAGTVRAIEAFLTDSLLAREEDGVVNWAAFIGEGAPRYILPYAPEPPTPDFAYLIINTTSRGAVDSLAARLTQHVFDRQPGVTAKFKPVPLGPPVNWPIEIRLSGREPDRLFRIVEEVKSQVGATPGTRNVRDDWGRRTKKILVRVNQPRARRAGVSSRDVAISLQTVLSGFATTEYREGDKVIPVTMRSVQADREDLGKIEGLNVYAQATGRSVPLKQVADLEVSWQPAKIVRRDRVWTVAVQAELEPGLTATEVNATLEPWLEEQRSGWGPGYQYAVGGEDEEAAKSQASIAAQMPIAGLIIILLLVGQFNSFRRPAIILLTIPMGLIGVVVGLLVARSYFGFMTLLGVISLAGIVINNAIVLLDRIKLEIEQNGLEPSRAIIEAAQRRLRPILLTTATTVGGLTPLWLGGGPMWEPMAIAIIFGLIFATGLTLGLVPVLYSLFFKVSFENFRY